MGDVALFVLILVVYCQNVLIYVMFRDLHAAHRIYLYSDAACAIRLVFGAERDQRGGRLHRDHHDAPSTGFAVANGAV